MPNGRDVTTGRTLPVIIPRLEGAARERDRCVHFNGMRNDRCAAGVAYADVRVDGDPIEYTRAPSRSVYTHSRSIPCLPSMNLHGATCPKFEVLSEEAARAKAEENERELELFLEATTRCAAHRKEHGVYSGTVECPKCGGALHYATARSNGHTHARCDTPNCIAWMQ